MDKPEIARVAIGVRMCGKAEASTGDCSASNGIVRAAPIDLGIIFYCVIQRVRILECGRKSPDELHRLQEI